MYLVDDDFNLDVQLRSLVIPREKVGRIRVLEDTPSDRLTLIIALTFILFAVLVGLRLYTLVLTSVERGYLKMLNACRVKAVVRVWGKSQ